MNDMTSIHHLKHALDTKSFQDQLSLYAVQTCFVFKIINHFLHD